MTLWTGDGLRVVELGGGISAAFAARLLADFGADVIKVEPPEGDPTRDEGPFPDDVRDREASGLFHYLNREKRSLVLDLTSESGRGSLQALVADADVVVENLGAAGLEALLPEGWPNRLVVVSISPFGQHGVKAHYRGGAIVSQAAGGMMYMTGTDDRPPLMQGGYQAAYLAGVNGAAAALAATRLARGAGRGQRIDISEQETVAMTIFPALNVYTHTGGVIKRAPVDLPRLATSQAMEASDGWVMPSDAGIDLWWEAFAGFIERPELLEPPLGERETRQANGHAIDVIAGPAFRERTKADLFHTGQEWGLTMSAVQTPAEILACPHLHERGYFVEQEVGGRQVRMPGMVPLTGGSSGGGLDRQPRRPAPRLGQHTEECLEAMGRGDRLPKAAASGRSSEGDLPLAGVKILELGMVFVLPLAVTPLAALGADVVKVEAAKRPDSVRSFPHPGNEARDGAYNHAGNFHLLNRNKRGITVDLSLPEGRELLLELVASADIVAENFTPRALRNLGLTYDELVNVNPDLIMLSSNGFGQSGPWQNYKAYGPTTESVDGLMHMTGYPDGPPIRAGAGGFGVAFTDVAGAYYGTYSMLAALEYRDRTGQGLWLDLSHYEAGVATLPEPLLEHAIAGRTPARTGNRHPRFAPQGAYPCAGVDEWLAISVQTDEQFAALTEALGFEGLPGWLSSHEARKQSHDEIDRLISEATCRCDARELDAQLQARGIPAAHLASNQDVWFDPQLRARGFAEWSPAPHYAPEIGGRVFPRPSWLMSETRGSTRTPAPAFGEHTREVLREWLAMPESAIERLYEIGVAAASPREGLVAKRLVDIEAMLASSRFREADAEYARRLRENAQT